MGGTTGITASGNAAGLTFSGTGTHSISASSGTLQLGAVTLNGAVAGGGQNITGLGTINGLAITANTGVITSGTWNATAIGAQYGGTGINTSASTGVPIISSGTWSTESQLAIARGGTNSNATPTQGGIAYGTGSAYAFTSAGTSGYLLTSNGTSAPAWTDPATLGLVSFWQEYLGAVSPKNITDDVLIGGTSTSSALTKFAGLSGGNSYVNTGNFGIGTTSPGYKLDVNGNTNITGTLAVSSTVNGLTLTPNGTGFSVAGGTTSKSLTVTGDTTLNGGGNTLSLTGNTTLAGGGHTLTLTANSSLNQDLLTTSSPTFANLTLNGNAQINGYATSSASLAVGYSSVTGGVGNAVFSGNVGIGTSNPAYALSVNSTTGILINQARIIDDNSNLSIANYNAGATLFYNKVGSSNTNLAYRFHTTTSNTPVLDILNNGNLGIGTTNPGYKLDVAGNTNLSSASEYYIAGTSVLNATTLGTGVTGSSLTSVGTIT